MGFVARIGRICGVVATLGTLVCVLTATVLAPSFSWAGSALSDLGVAGGPAQFLFNGGLIAGGVVGVPFAWWRARSAETQLGVIAGAAFGFTMLAMAGVGLFPIGSPLHAPVSITFFCLLTYTLALDGSAAVLANCRRRGLVWHWVALGHVTAWLVWAGWTAVVGTLGIAIPEAVGAFALGVWVLTTARDPWFA